MKATLTSGHVNRVPVAVITSSGALMLRDRTSHRGSNKTIAVGSQRPYGAHDNGTCPIDDMDSHYTRVYEGDTVTLQF